MNKSEQILFSRRELADRFRVTQQTIIRWEKAGLLNSWHLCSGTVRYTKDEVDRFIAQQIEARPTKRRTADAAQA